jgi:hypothetical protein
VIRVQIFRVGSGTPKENGIRIPKIIPDPQHCASEPIVGSEIPCEVKILKICINLNPKQ